MRLIKKLILAAGAMVLVAILFGAFMLPMESTAYSVEDRIYEQLGSIGITDAVREQNADETLGEELFLCYSSKSLGLKLFFQEDTGLLRWADTCGDAQNRNEINTVSGSVEMTQEARLQESRNWAELLLGENRIGDLVQKEEAIERWISFVEYYEGQPTGTSVTVIWDGNVVDSVVTYIGEIFEKDRLGRVVPKNREEKIAQERAIEIGIAYIEDAAANDILDLDTVGCELQIFGGRWTYQISAETEPDAGGFTTTFVAVLDPWTGELVEMRRSV